MRYALPIGLFVVVVIFLAIGLERDPRYVPSPLIGKPLPAFELPVLDAGAPPLGRAQLAGRVFLLNVWASWCVSCREEHPVLNALAARGEVPVIGLNYKDERAAAQRWLEQRGDPYETSLFDHDGKLGLDLGVYGVPETFLVDGTGIIRYKHVGPLTEAVLERDVLPLVRQYGGGS
ncbi:MAG: DsbE family thiol:disulfide interchange protein [Gammaproteobacteria bacterium]|nr:DsbE family thiol:disulfide interchange protein [Gammaproteobacteria bacterium]MCP5201007.1 DsbE family thiol:disulfide interchange protein [Gammaproteobacteria bacterium]